MHSVDEVAIHSHPKSFREIILQTQIFSEKANLTKFLLKVSQSKTSEISTLCNAHFLCAPNTHYNFKYGV